MSSPRLRDSLETHTPCPEPVGSTPLTRVGLCGRGGRVGLRMVRLAGAVGSGLTGLGEGGDGLRHCSLGGADTAKLGSAGRVGAWAGWADWARRAGRASLEGWAGGLGLGCTTVSYLSGSSARRGGGPPTEHQLFTYLTIHQVLNLNYGVVLSGECGYSQWPTGFCSQ